MYGGLKTMILSLVISMSWIVIECYVSNAFLGRLGVIINSNFDQV